MESMIIFVASLTLVNFVYSILLTKKLDGIVEEICEEINYLEKQQHDHQKCLHLLSSCLKKETKTP